MLRLMSVLLAGLVCFGTIHASWDDVACDPAPAHHDHNAHKFRSGPLPSGAQDHCLFCHSLRSLGNGLVSAGAALTDTSQGADIRASVAASAGRYVDPNAPSRAPPHVLL